MKLQEILPYIQQGVPFIYDQDDGLYSDEELFEEGAWQYLDTMGYFEYWIGAIKGNKWRIPKLAFERGLSESSSRPASPGSPAPSPE